MKENKVPLLRYYLINLLIVQVIAMIIPLFLGDSLVSYMNIIFFMLISNVLFFTIYYFYLSRTIKRQLRKTNKIDIVLYLTFGLLLLVISPFLEIQMFVVGLTLSILSFSDLLRKKYIGKRLSLKEFVKKRYLFVNCVLVIPIIIDLNLSFYFNVPTFIYFIVAIVYSILYLIWSIAKDQSLVSNSKLKGEK
jgi:hypothetical protein